jgi:transcriptional regulator with GAF, ATPase, and Fis domain
MSVTLGKIRLSPVAGGVLPCQFKDGIDAASLKLDGSETFDLEGTASGITPQQDVTLVIHRANGSTERVALKLRQQLDARYGLENIIGQSAPMVEMLDTIRQVAPSRASVLIEGESGTGKEVVARAVHQLSPRHNGSFVAVHCAALSLNLLESELFGHEKGAFTGAIERRIGRFEEYAVA